MPAHKEGHRAPLPTPGHPPQPSASSKKPTVVGVSRPFPPSSAPLLALADHSLGTRAGVRDPLSVLSLCSPTHSNRRAVSRAALSRPLRPRHPPTLLPAVSSRPRQHALTPTLHAPPCSYSRHRLVRQGQACVPRPPPSPRPCLLNPGAPRLPPLMLTPPPCPPLQSHAMSRLASRSRSSSSASARSRPPRCPTGSIARSVDDSLSAWHCAGVLHSWRCGEMS